MNEPKLDAWTELQTELAKVEALHRSHPEMFHLGSVSFQFFPDLDLPSIGFHMDRGLNYAFAKQHQESGWVQNELGNWNGIVAGLKVCLFGMKEIPDKTPITFSTTDEERAVAFVKDPTIEKAMEIMGQIPRKDPEFI